MSDDESVILFWCMYSSASRFEGDLNVDLNEITMNLVPYPRLHYLVSAISPLYTLKDVSLPPRRSIFVCVCACACACVRACVCTLVCIICCVNGVDCCQQI